MLKLRVIRPLVLVSMAGLILAVAGCGGSSLPPTGGVVKEDPKVVQDREKMIADQYKSKPTNVPPKK